jgi:hypothetical protein
VLGKQLANIHLSLSFASRAVTSLILASTAWDTKSLSCGAGRCDSYFTVWAPIEDEAKAKAMIKKKRFILQKKNVPQSA